MAGLLFRFSEYVGLLQNILRKITLTLSPIHNSEFQDEVQKEAAPLREKISKSGSRTVR